MSTRPSAQAVPNPERSWGAYRCGHIVGTTDHALFAICGERFVFRRWYEDHWLTEHAPNQPVPKTSGADYLAEHGLPVQPRASGGPISPAQRVLITPDDGYITPLHEHRPVWERAAAEMGLVPDENGVINLSDAILPDDRSGAVFVEEHVTPNVGICKHPDCLARNETHLSPGLQWPADEERYERSRNALRAHFGLPSRPFNVKAGLVIEHGEDWAPQVINVDGVDYKRGDL